MAEKQKNALNALVADKTLTQQLLQQECEAIEANNALILKCKDEIQEKLCATFVIDVFRLPQLLLLR